MNTAPGSLEAWHTILEIGVPILLGLLMYIGLLIKNAIGHSDKTTAALISASDKATANAIAGLNMVIAKNKSDLTEVMDKDRSMLLATQNEVKQELIKTGSNTQRQLDVHEAKDEEKFSGISRTLSRQDSVLDRIEKSVNEMLRRPPKEN